MAAAIWEQNAVDAAVVILPAFNAHSTSGRKFCGRGKGSGSGFSTGFYTLVTTSLIGISPSTKYSTIRLSAENKEDAELLLRFREGVQLSLRKSKFLPYKTSRTYLVSYIHRISTTGSTNWARFYWRSGIVNLIEENGISIMLRLNRTCLDVSMSFITEELQSDAYSLVWSYNVMKKGIK